MINLGLIFGLTALYFAIILGLVVYARLKETKQLLPGLNEFFLAKKDLHPAILASTFAASIFSTFTVLGVPGMVYAQGIGAIYFIAVFDIVGLLVFFWIALKIRKYAQENRCFSPVEIISHFYASRNLGLYISILFCIFLIPLISLQLVGIGKFLEGYTGGDIGYVTGVGGMMLIVMIYLFLGGMRAVAYTDIIQLVAILIGMGFGMFYLFGQHDLTFMQLWSETLSEENNILTVPGPAGVWTWSMIFTSGLVLVGIMFQPHLLTRAMMAAKEQDIKIICITTLVARNVINFFTIGFAMAALKLLGPDMELNSLMGSIFEMMGSAGTIGLILSGLMLMGALGAAMSTADSLLISIGQVATRDIIRPNMKLDPKTQILISKGIMFAVLAAAFLAGLNPPKIMVDLGVYSGAACALLIPTILCMTWKRRSLLASYISIGTGIAALVFFAGYKMIYAENLFGVHPGFIPLILSFALYFSICFATYERKTAEAVRA